MHWFAMVTGLWSIATLAVFVGAIRLSYRIEARSPDLRNRSGVPRYAALFHTLFNLRVSRDAETQSMRRRMIWLLIAVALGFVAFGLLVRIAVPMS